MTTFFKTFEFDFEATRLMWYAPSGGSDFAEVKTVCGRIKEGNYEDWYQQWAKWCEQLLKRSEQLQSPVSKGNIYLRVSRYYQAAEFFLHPSDERKQQVYQKSVSYFYQALDLLGIPYQLNAIPFRHFAVRSVYFQTNKPCKGTLFVCSGFDGLLEELYFTNAVAALQEGYNVVLFEGPGQSDCIRKYEQAFTPDWHEVCSVVVDFYRDTIVRPTIGVGLSLGGLLMARAQSVESTLFDRIVLYNYFPPMLDSFKQSIPSFLHRYVDTSFPPLLEKIATRYIASQPFLNWQVEHAKWTFGQKSLNELLHYCRLFSEQLLTTPCLILLARNDNYYDYKQGIRYYKAIPSKNKKLIIFDTDTFSSDLHCQNGASYDSNEQMFEWLSQQDKLKRDV